ncbi:MAG: hypothetical protein LYZ70_06350 [Nitrososphaerales archaeon]|nr:hypothetical protein [Nitrososphaerales archaeon]
MTSLAHWARLLSPALLVFAATMIVSLASDTSYAVFLAPSPAIIPVRFMLMTLILLVQLPLVPRIISVIWKQATSRLFLGEFVKRSSSRASDYSRTTNMSIVWLVRPLQGIGLGMIFAVRLLNIFELSSSEGASISVFILRPVFFVVSSALVALLLSVVWTLDDLGIRIYNAKTGEVRMAGASVGTILPILFGALGIYGLFQSSGGIASGALIFVGIAMVLYPPFSIFAVVHKKFVARHFVRLSSKTDKFRQVETEIR